MGTNGNYPMSFRSHGDKVEVTVCTPIGINCVLSKRLPTAGTTDDFSDGWHIRFDICKSLGESSITKGLLMHCALDFKGNPTEGFINQSLREDLAAGHLENPTSNTLKFECDFGLKVFDKLTLWNTFDFFPADPINDKAVFFPVRGWNSQCQVEIQDLLSCDKFADLMQYTSSKSGKVMTSLKDKAFQLWRWTKRICTAKLPSSQIRRRCCAALNLYIRLAHISEVLQ